MLYCSTPVFIDRGKLLISSMAVSITLLAIKNTRIIMKIFLPCKYGVTRVNRQCSKHLTNGHNIFYFSDFDFHLPKWKCWISRKTWPFNSTMNLSIVVELYENEERIKKVNQILLSQWFIIDEKGNRWKETEIGSKGVKDLNYMD